MVHGEAAAQEREASDADWEQRLKAAIDSAEKWQAFAGGLEADKGKLELQAVELAAKVKVIPNMSLQCSHR